MKKNLFILFALFNFLLISAIQAQVSISLNVNSNPNPNLYEWENHSELAMLTVTNTDQALVGTEYKIKVIVKLNDKVVLETNNNVATQKLTFGSQTFLADEIFPENALVFKDNSLKDNIVRTGMLPSGTYDFCVSVLNLSGKVISKPENACQPMMIMTYEMPELLTPLNNQEITTLTVPSIIFSWSPLSPTPQPTEGVKYILTVTQVMDRQSPARAFQVNRPIIEEEVMGTQFRWPVDIDIPDDSTQFVWSVKPVTLQGSSYFEESNGFVRYKTFTIKPEITTPLVEELPDTIGSLAVGDTINAGRNHEFKIQVTEVSLNTSSYSGKGVVEVNFLRAKVAVEFSNIKIDASKNLTEGNISGELYADIPTYPHDWAIAAIANIPWTTNTLNSIVNWVENHTGNNINLTEMVNENIPLVRFPLGLNFRSGDQLAITEMVFQSNMSKMNIVAAKNIPPSWHRTGQSPQLVGFLAKDVEFRPSRLESAPKRIELVEDITVGNINNKITYTFKKPTNPTIGGCYIQWDENGFSQFGVDLDVAFTRDWLLPVPDDGTTKTKANFVSTVSDWNNMVLTGNLQKSEIVSTQGMTISAGDITLDMSDSINSQHLSAEEDFPENFSGDKTVTFRGLHMKTLSVDLPTTFSRYTGSSTNISINDMIIHDMGVTLYATATNVLQFPQANVIDLSASIDTVLVDIRNSTMHEAYIKGKIGLPLSKADSIQNPLIYNALFHNSGRKATVSNYFQLTVEPTGPIYASLLKGTMNLDETSNLEAYIDKTKKTFDFNIDGNLVWQNTKLDMLKNVNMTLGFQNIRMNYDSSLPTNQLRFNAGTWSFASPQKYMANFPITIENISYNSLSKAQNQYMHGKLNFDVIFNLSEEIGGRSNMEMEVAIEENQNASTLGKFKPKYIKTTLNEINLQAHLPAVSIDGTILFRHDDPIFGDGFRGDVEASFKVPSAAITALAEFGNTNYRNGDAKYRYWRVEAAARFQPGIAFLPGLAFYGFGGGAYNNMESKLEYNATLGKNIYTFTPKLGNLGFKVNGTIGTSPKVETFNSDIGLNGEFSSSQGLVNIGFTGDFYVGAKLTPQSEREQAQIRGNMVANYNFPEKHFFFSTNVNINKPPMLVANNQQLVFDINGLTNRWYYKFGEPTNTNDVNVFGINLYSYMMFGNDITPPIHGFTETFRNNYHSVVNSYPQSNNISGVDANSATGRGMAYGLGVEFNSDVNQHLMGKYYLDLNIDAGAEINLSLLEYSGQNCANTSQRIGFAGWRASGNVGAYVDAGASVRKERENRSDIFYHLANFKAAAWLNAKFPRPHFASGHISGRVEIADIISRDFTANFKWGDECAENDRNYSVNTGTTVTQEDAAEDQENLIQYVNPTTITNLQTDIPISVKYGLPLNESFDVAEQQSDGSIITRTFKLTNNVNLRKLDKNTNQFVTVNIKTERNNLGEYLYSHNISLTTNPVSTNSNNRAGQVTTATNNPSRNVVYPTPTSNTNNESSTSNYESSTFEKGETYKIRIQTTLMEYKNRNWTNVYTYNNRSIEEIVTREFSTSR